jgi:magnesium-protoporphyrin IX monomethyl ester (oxidative) cyclase
MGKRVLLLEPPVIIREGEFHQCLPPLGLLYIASTLRGSGYEVSLLDACVEGWKNRATFEEGWDYKGLSGGEIRERLTELRPDIVGISWKFSRQERAFKIALEAVRQALGGVPVIVGGAHPSSNPEDVLKRYDVDYIVLGEGEETIRALLASLDAGKDFEKIDGIAYRNADRVEVRSKHNYIDSLDELPFPARDLAPMELYSEDNRANTFEGDMREFPKTTIITSRGCPEKCTFCAIKGVWGRKYRTRSAENVYREVDELVNKYGVREIHFLDDNLTLDKKRAERIFDLIIERGLKFTWRTPNGVSSKTLDPALISKMKESGCYRLSLGIESGNARILNEVIKKSLDLDRVKQVGQWIKEAGLECEGFFILGMPGEDSGTIMDTIRFAMEMDLDSAAFFSAQPYPGTELFNMCVDKGYMEDKGCEFLMTFNPSIDTPWLSKDELRQWQRIANYLMLMKKRKAGAFIRLKYISALVLLRYYAMKRRVRG